MKNLVIARRHTAKAAGHHIEYRLLIISDHRTFVRTKQHEGSPVPFILYDSRVDTKRGVTYTEENGMNGPDVPHGDKLLDILFENIPLL